MVFVLKGGKYSLRYLYRKELSEKYEIKRVVFSNDLRKHIKHLNNCLIYLKTDVKAVIIEL